MKQVLVFVPGLVLFISCKINGDAFEGCPGVRNMIKEYSQKFVSVNL